MKALTNGKTISLHISPQHLDTCEPGALSKMLRDLANEVDQWEEVDTGITQVQRDGNKLVKIIVHDLLKPTWEVIVGKSAERAYTGSNEAKATTIFETFKSVGECYLLRNGKIISEHV